MEEHNVYILDVDYEIDEKDRMPVVKIFGKTDKKKSVLVLHKEFLPYFYAYPDQAKVTKVREEIEKTDYKDNEMKILKTEIVEKTINAEKLKLIKITTNSPHKIPETRERIKDLPNVLETYEYDIPFYKRYLIDNDLRPLSWVKVKGKEAGDGNFEVDLVLEASSIKQTDLQEEPHLKILAYDIEILEEKNKEVLIMISAAGNDGFKKVITTWQWDKKQNFVEVVKDEKALLERFIEVVKENDPDILVDYNGDGFDMQKLRQRAEDLKVKLGLGRNNAQVIFVRRGRDTSAKVKGRVHIDLFVFIANQLKFMLKSETLSLDSVASELLGVGKKQLKFIEMKELWKNKTDVERIAEYSMWDSELTLKLAEHLIPQIFSVSRLTGLTPFDGSRAMYSRLVEGFYMKKAFEDNVVAPSRPHEEEREARMGFTKYKGAIVIEPKAGIHSNISVFDFRSLYPSVIVSHNISPETFGCSHKECKEKNSVPDTNYHFCTKVKGFISRHLEDVLKERQKVKTELKKHKRGTKEYIELDNLQGALKIIANATYGYFAYFGAKWYRRECGEAAAAFGRYYITQVVDLAKKSNFEIIYGDTDSLMASYPEEKNIEMLKKNSQDFAEEANKKLPGIIELEFRGLYESGIFVTIKGTETGAKKRYALCDYDGRIEVKGFETVRRDWCELSRRIQREVLTIVLKEKKPEKALELVKKTIRELKAGTVKLEELSTLEQITRPLAKYEQLGPHVKAAMKAQKRGRPIVEGTLINFVITKGKGSISDRAEPVEDVKQGDYDPEYYIGHQVVPAAMRVLSALGYEDADLLGKKQFKLTHF